MPFGPYRGKELASLPTDYLAWALRAVPEEGLRHALRAEYKARIRRARQHRNGHEPSGGASTAPGLSRELVERGRRELARKYHPDVGGNNGELMKGVNLLADWLPKGGSDRGRR
jgi:hypothetical protein